MGLLLDTDNVAPLSDSGGRRNKLQEQDVLYIEQLKREKPSIDLKAIKDKLDRFSNVDVSLKTVCCTLNDLMQDGRYSRKILNSPAAKKFTQHNLQYTEAFLDYVSRQNPYKLEFFGESGFNMPDALKRKYDILRFDNVSSR
jgi:hypothetical protein